MSVSVHYTRCRHYRNLWIGGHTQVVYTTPCKHAGCDGASPLELVVG